LGIALIGQPEEMDRVMPGLVQQFRQIDRDPAGAAAFGIAAADDGDPQRFRGRAGLVQNATPEIAMRRSFKDAQEWAQPQSRCGNALKRSAYQRGIAGKNPAADTAGIPAPVPGKFS
jgi:hypothetical protein